MKHSLCRSFIPGFVTFAAAGCGARDIGNAIPGDDLTGLVAEYDFEDASDLGKDSARQNDAVEVVNARQAEGHIGRAVQLDNGHLLLPTVSELMLATVGDFSLEIWINTDRPNLNFFTCATVKIHTWGLAEYWPDLTPQMVVNGIEGAMGYTNLYDGQWHHVVGMRTGVATLKIYVDGRLEGTRVANTPIVDINCTIALGQDGACCGGFTGRMDRARVWQRALTDGEVLAFSKE